MLLLCHHKHPDAGGEDASTLLPMECKTQSKPQNPIRTKQQSQLVSGQDASKAGILRRWSSDVN